ncbi:unnamed protein product, partial [Nesidiocoris tenuis]
EGIPNYQPSTGARHRTFSERLVAPEGTFSLPSTAELCRTRSCLPSPASSSRVRASRFPSGPPQSYRLNWLEEPPRARNHCLFTVGPMKFDALVSVRTPTRDCSSLDPFTQFEPFQFYQPTSSYSNRLVINCHTGEVDSDLIQAPLDSNPLRLMTPTEPHSGTALDGPLTCSWRCGSIPSLEIDLRQLPTRQKLHALS